MLIFPCAYLLLMVPLTFLDGITVPMQVLMTTFSTGVLKGMGIDVLANGVDIYLGAVPDFRLEVAVGKGAEVDVKRILPELSVLGLLGATAGVPEGSF